MALLEEDTLLLEQALVALEVSGHTIADEEDVLAWLELVCAFEQENRVAREAGMPVHPDVALGDRCRAHLIALYPFLCHCVASESQRVRLAVRRALLLAGAEMGIVHGGI